MLCFEEKKADSPAKLYVMEVGRDKDAPGGGVPAVPSADPQRRGRSERLSGGDAGARLTGGVTDDALNDARCARGEGGVENDDGWGGGGKTADDVVVSLL